jgi:hypothetical protein
LRWWNLKEMSASIGRRESMRETGMALRDDVPISQMNPGPYRPLYLWGPLVGGSKTNRPLPRGSSSRPMVARLVLGTVRCETKDKLFFCTVPLMNVVLHEHVLHAFTPGDRPPSWRQRSWGTLNSHSTKLRLWLFSHSATHFLSFPRVKSASRALRIGRALSC